MGEDDPESRQLPPPQALRCGRSEKTSTACVLTPSLFGWRRKKSCLLRKRIAYLLFPLQEESNAVRAGPARLPKTLGRRECHAKSPLAGCPVWGRFGSSNPRHLPFLIISQHHWNVCYNDLLAVSQFAGSDEERQWLWCQVNRMAEETKKRDLTALWFLPIDAISFSQSLCVTSGIESGLSRISV